MSVTNMRKDRLNKRETFFFFLNEANVCVTGVCEVTEAPALTSSWDPSLLRWCSLGPRGLQVLPEGLLQCRTQQWNSAVFHQHRRVWGGGEAQKEREGETEKRGRGWGGGGQKSRHIIVTHQPGGQQQREACCPVSCTVLSVSREQRVQTLHRSSPQTQGNTQTLKHMHRTQQPPTHKKISFKDYM